MIPARHRAVDEGLAIAMANSYNPQPVPTPLIPTAPRDLHGRWTLFKILEAKRNDQIRGELGEAYLPCPPDVELDTRRRAHPRPPQFSLTLPLNSVSRGFLMLRFLDGVAENTSETRHAIGVLRSARLREFVESGLLVGVPESSIATAAKELLGRQLEPSQVRAFASLFFRLDVLTRAQIHVLVEQRVRCTLHGLGDAVTTAQVLALDARIVALNLPPIAASWMKVLEAMGFDSLPRCLRELLASPSPVTWRRR